MTAVVQAVFALLILFCLGVAPSQLQAQTTLGTEFPLGVGFQLKNGDMTTAALDKAQASGVKVVRKGIYWANIETSQGVYDWSTTDSWINDMESRGFTMVITVVWNNRIYEDIWDRAIVTQAGRDAYANFAADVVSRYQGKDIIWEIWNEPNLRSFWHENPENKSNTDEMAEEYTALVLDAVPAMKTADPNCRIAVCSISALWSQSFSWFERCIEVGLLNADIDAISVHPYGFRWPELAMLEGYPVIRQLLDDNGGTDVAMISSEVGYPEGWLTARGFTTAQVEDVQAWQFVRQNLIDAMSDVQLGIWYELTDPEWGVLENNLTERPTFTAAQVLTTELNGYSFQERIDLGDVLDFAALFVNAAGDKKLVVWTTPEKTGALNTRRPVDHVVAVPVGEAGDYVVTDIFGATTTLTTSSATLDVMLTGAPQYIPLPETVVTYGNIALGLVPTASSPNSSYGDPAALTDGDYTNSGRFFTNYDSPQWIEVDLGGDFVVDQVVMVQQTDRIGDWNVEIWDGSGWVQVASALAESGQNDVTASFSPVVASKVRFNVVSQNLYLKLYEMEIYGSTYVAPPPASYENVALGVAPTASSTGTSYADPAALTDGNYTNSGRFFTGYDSPQWIEIDFGSSHTVDQLVMTQQTDRIGDWNIEVWDGSAWSQVASSAAVSGENVITATFTPVSCTKLRFNITSQNLYLKLYEMEIYGSADP
ncbi:MAG: discoidin domain-containing protein [Verrucomicrobiota bacterium]